MIIILNKVSRKENIRIRIRIDHPLKKDILLCKILNPLMYISSMDTVNIDYHLELDYLGEVEKRLKAILGLAKRGAIAKISIKELHHKEILIRDIFNCIQELQKTLKQKRE
jgi:hypothetical protein